MLAVDFILPASELRMPEDASHWFARLESQYDDNPRLPIHE